jgi:glycerophosphoryl diester phosphodiesterase
MLFWGWSGTLERVSSDDHPYLSGPYPRAFAHRGWHIDDLTGMENSLSAFRRAVQEGFRYLETDVHATSDGVVVIQHDDALDRTTDGAGAVVNQPWAVVREVKVGGREPVCRLDELLEELPEALINIDVKADSAIDPVISTLRRCDALGRVCLASFSDARLARLRKLGGPELLTSMGPGSVAAVWAAAGTGLPLGGLAKGRMAQVPRKQGPLTVVTPRFVQFMHKRAQEVHVWTVDEPAEMRELLEWGVDGLVTDRPDLLREVLAERV